MSYSYRILKQVTKIPLGDIDTTYSIHEVYTDENENIVNISEKPSPIIGDDIESIGWQIERMMEACNKPVIDYNTGEELNKQSPAG